VTVPLPLLAACLLREFRKWHAMPREYVNGHQQLLRISICNVIWRSRLTVLGRGWRCTQRLSSTWPRIRTGWSARRSTWWGTSTWWSLWRSSRWWPCSCRRRLLDWCLRILWCVRSSGGELAWRWSNVARWRHTAHTS
jgi:hypothetical protein